MQYAEENGDTFYPELIGVRIAYSMDAFRLSG